jgi:ABC-2 type transport system ATP-binding protein
MSLLTINSLESGYGKIPILHGVDLYIDEGELVAVIGPNGAGKTTTLNMLTTLITPSSGSAIVAGYNIITEKDAVRRNIGVVFQDPALDTSLTGRENLDFHSMMYGMERDERKARINEVLELVELKDKANILVQNYSGGMKRRLEMARGLIQSPKVLFLDEPTIGLDPESRHEVWQQIRILNSENTTVILTTHYMDEAERLGVKRLLS